MKPRKVMVHLEMESDVSLSLLRDKTRWQDVVGDAFYDSENTLHQVTVQVVKEGK